MHIFGVDNDYSVPEDVVARIDRAVKNVQGDFKPVFYCRYSNIPGDDYLYLVIAKGGTFNGYACWLYNNSGTVGGLHEGHYDMSFKSAMELVGKKVRYYGGE